MTAELVVPIVVGVLVVGLGVAAVRAQARGVGEPTSAASMLRRTRIVCGSLAVVAALIAVAGAWVGADLWPSAPDVLGDSPDVDLSMGLPRGPAVFVWIVTLGLVALLAGVAALIWSVESMRVERRVSRAG